MTFYSALVIVEIFAALVLAVFISKNPMVDKKVKWSFSHSFIVLAIVCFSECMNINLNGTPDSFRVLHYVVKLTEFICVPVIPGINLLAFPRFKQRKALIILLASHAVFEIVCAFFGLVFYMDKTNSYFRGPLYFVFVIFYLSITALLFFEVIYLGKSFQNNNYLLIALGGLFLVSGVSIQIYDSTIRVSWLCVELTIIMAYIYINDLTLQTDNLTGLLNRWCYEKRLESVDYDSVVMFFDVDSFKSINDTFGHAVGDEALRLVAHSIFEHFGREAKCYRIGGDEFCAVFKKNSKYSISQSEEMLGALIDRFELDIKDIRKADPRFTGVSVGYSFVNKDFEIYWAVECADRKMYEYKKKNKDTD